MQKKLSKQHKCVDEKVSTNRATFCEVHFRSTIELQNGILLPRHTTFRNRHLSLMFIDEDK